MNATRRVEICVHKVQAHRCRGRPIIPGQAQNILDPLLRLYHLCSCGKGQICSFFVGILIHCSSLTFDSVNHKQNQLCWLEFASPGGSQSATDDQRDRPAPPPPPCTSSSVDAHCVVEHVSSNCLNLQLT